MRLADRARALRKQLTPQETRLWLRLRALRAQGLHFRRQAPFQNCILDFVCFDRRLAVEIDGSQHAEGRHEQRDAQRDAALAREDFLTLRFWNGEVNDNIENVVETIFARAMERAPTRSHPAPAAARRTLAMKGTEGAAP